jgi:hypothetical protein
MELLANSLHNSEKFSFNIPPSCHIPLLAAGVYTVYDNEDRFLYVGMAGADLNESKIDALSKIPRRKSGLCDRLTSHASGYRSGDKFNIYICDLFVLKTLTTEQIKAISEKKLSLDSINREYIRNNLSYRFIITKNEVVRELENYIQRNGINGILPFINPR